MPAPQLIYAMLTDPGLVRKGNEDACAASPKDGAYVVCDGMGGAAAGEVASHLATQTFLEQLAAPAGRAEPKSADSVAAANAQARMSASVSAANHAVYEKARHDPNLAGMGTTLVALLHAPGPRAARVEAPVNSTGITIPPAPPALWLAHVGDSRCYLYRNRELFQLTDDHSLVEEQLRAGQITAAEAARSPMRNYITRAVGSQPSVEIEIQGLRTLPGDLYLLASDGLNRELPDADIAMILAEVPSPPTQPYLAAACQSLVNAANHNGGRDNITVLIVAITRGIERRKSRRA